MRPDSNFNKNLENQEKQKLKEIQSTLTEAQTQ
jgi:Zn-dependent M16 (insulinase) family peptidase